MPYHEDWCYTVKDEVFGTLPKGKVMVKLSHLPVVGIICATILASLCLLSTTVLYLKVPVRRTITFASIPQPFVLSSKDTKNVDIINGRLSTGSELTGEVSNKTPYGLSRVQILVVVRSSKNTTQVIAQRREVISCSVEPGISQAFSIKLDKIANLSDTTTWDWYYRVEEVQGYKME
jgi:energy-converting hydrogenase Eha subunit H